MFKSSVVGAFGKSLQTLLSTCKSGLFASRADLLPKPTVQFQPIATTTPRSAIKDQEESNGGYSEGGEAPGNFPKGQPATHAYSREVLEKLNFDKFPYYIERNWDTDGKRLTFWATFRMKRDNNARKILHQNGRDRTRFRAMKINNVLPQVIVDEFSEKMLNMYKYCHPQHINSMCMFTGRTRGKIKRFRVNRHIFRRLCDHGQLSGVQRAFWT